MKWPSGTPRPSTASYTVHHAAGTTEVTRDQRTGGGEWDLFGSFLMTPGAGHRVVLSDEADKGQVHDVIIDNDSIGTAHVGTWITHNWLGGGRPYGASFQRMDAPETFASFTWPASYVPERGLYRVYARWPANYGGTGYSVSADFTINHVGGATTVSVNQRESGGQWMPLGSFELEPSEGTLIELSGYENNGYLIADAVRIVRLKGPAEDVIVDDEDPSTTITGTWSSSSWTGGGAPVGSVFHYKYAGTGAAKISYPLGISSAGKYRVYARWSSMENRASDVKYTVFHDGGSTQVTVNQEYNGGIWMLLGVFDLSPGASPRVEVTDNANEYVVPDAVRAVRHTTAETEFIVDNQSPGVTVVGSWVTATTTDYGMPYDGNCIYAQNGGGANSITWPLAVPAAGKYQLYTRWIANTTHNTQATYTVHHAGGTTEVRFNQQASGGVWRPMGLFDLAPGAGHKVVLTDQGSLAVIGDAIKVVPIETDTHAVVADAVKLVANDAEDLLYVHADHLGSPRKMTDAGRAVVWDASFEPFGTEDSILGAETNDQRFPGQYFDGETGFHYNYFRDYDPALGRYTKSDPIGLRGGLNTYIYAWGNPITQVDPFGLDSLRFDGARLSHIDNAGGVVQSWPAVSGAPGSGPADSYRRNYGPIPEGDYSVDPNKVNYDRWWKWGWGNSDDWGTVRTPIDPKSGTNTGGRDEMYIHGGRRPGSIGCIDLTGHNDHFHDWLKRQSGPVDLTVDYPNYRSPYAQ